MSTIRAVGNVAKLFAVRLSINPASNAAATTQDNTVTIQGVLPGDMVFANKPSSNAGLGIANIRVSGANTIILTTINATAGAVDAAAENYDLLIVRPEVTPPGVFNA